MKLKKKTVLFTGHGKKSIFLNFKVGDNVVVVLPWIALWSCNSYKRVLTENSLGQVPLQFEERRQGLLSSKDLDTLRPQPQKDFLIFFYWGLPLMQHVQVVTMRVINLEAPDSFTNIKNWFISFNSSADLSLLNDVKHK